MNPEEEQAQRTQVATSLVGQDVVDSLRNIERALGSPPNALVNLILEDDWSLVVKGQALLEGAVTFLLSSVLDPKLKEVFARLPIGDKETGKLEFAKALGLLTKAERRFVTTLLNLRNALAHDLRFLSFTFKDHISGLDKNQKAAFFDSIAYDVGAKSTDEWKRLLDTVPKVAVGMGIMRLVVHCTAQGQLARLDKAQMNIDYAKAFSESNGESA